MLIVGILQDIPAASVTPSAVVEQADAASWTEALFWSVILHAGSTEDLVTTTASSVGWVPIL